MIKPQSTGVWQLGRHRPLLEELNQILAAWYASPVKIKEVIAVVNQMQADGVIERYAVGGAVGATFYLEPVATLDVDIFTAFKPHRGV